MTKIFLSNATLVVNQELNSRFLLRHKTPGKYRNKSAQRAHFCRVSFCVPAGRGLYSTPGATSAQQHRTFYCFFFQPPDGVADDRSFLRKTRAPYLAIQFLAPFFVPIVPRARCPGLRYFRIWSRPDMWVLAARGTGKEAKANVG